MSDTDDTDDVQRVHRAAVDRQHERARAVEDLVATIDDELEFPTRSDEVAATYATTLEDLPTETGSLAEALDRVDGVGTEAASFDPEPPSSVDRLTPGDVSDVE